MTTVSIVLPTYNGEKYLRQSIDSILAQTYTDWELIIVDDASVDETGKIADEYDVLDDRIRVIHNVENRKLPQSLNIGFADAKGRYLTWTSDDNLFKSNALEVMVQYLDRYDNVYMVRAEMLMIDENGSVIEPFGPYSDEKMYAYDCVGACFMYRKEVRDTIGDYDVDMFCVEDYDYWLRVLNHYGKIVPIDQILYQYRVHGSSLTALKRQQVREQLTRLRIRYADRMFESLRDDRKELYRIYFEMRRSKDMTKEMTERFISVFPALRREVPFIESENYIIFGAGKYGEKAVERLGYRASFFTDSDLHKAGNIKCGLKILSFSEAVKLKENYRFLIAAAGLRSYEMMVQLQEAGVMEYSLFEI